VVSIFLKFEAGHNLDTLLQLWHMLIWVLHSLIQPPFRE
jgi:hypothetical protein